MRYRHNSLAAYLHKTFIPKKLKGRVDGTITTYKTSISQLCCFVAHDITLGEVNDALLEWFDQWLVSTGHTQRTREVYRACIRAVVRHARPGECPKHRGKRPHEKLAVGNEDARWDSEGSVWRFFRQTYRPERMVGCTVGSVVQHLVAIRLMCRYLGRPAMVADLTDEQVTGFMQWLLDQGHSRVTVNSKRQSILAVWRYAYKKKLGSAYPSVDKLKEYRRLPVAWTEQELTRLLTACASTRGKLGPIVAGDWWVALILTMYDTSLRRGACMSIERQHVDLKTGWLIVPAEVQKQKAEQRFQLSEQTVEAIRKIWLPLRIPLFVWPWGERQIWHHLHKILDRAGLPNGRLNKFHKLRKTTASHIAKVAGIDAAGRQLGHSGEYVTKRYIDPTIAQSQIDGVVHLPRPRLN